MKNITLRIEKVKSKLSKYKTFESPLSQQTNTN